MRKKILSVSKMLRIFTILREERETLMQIKSFTPENKIPPGLLSKGVDAIRDALGDFEKAKTADQVNEKRPPVNTNQAPAISNARLHLIRSRSNSSSDLTAVTSTEFSATKRSTCG